MGYRNSECDNITKYRILTQSSGIVNRDIRTLTGCSGSAALKIINAIHEKIAATPGALMPVKGRVTRKSFCEYMGWDFSEIRAFAFSEMAVMTSANSNTYQKDGFHAYGNF